jgi:hypothetical protein
VKITDVNCPYILNKTINDCEKCPSIVGCPLVTAGAAAIELLRRYRYEAPVKHKCGVDYSADFDAVAAKVLYEAIKARDQAHSPSEARFIFLNNTRRRERGRDSVTFS